MGYATRRGGGGWQRVDIATPLERSGLPLAEVLLRILPKFFTLLQIAMGIYDDQLLCGILLTI